MYTYNGYTRGGNYGDYYRGDYYRGDPGFLGGLVKGIGRGLVGFATGGVAGAALGVLGGLKNKTTAAQGTALAPIPPMQYPTSRTRITAFPPGYTHEEYAPEYKMPTERQAYAQLRLPGRRRRMNVANAKALRRALRRVAGFGKLAKRAKRDIARAASAVGVRRGGGRSPGVITRSEAARALRR